MLLSKLWHKRISKFHDMGKNTYFYFLQKKIACKNFETLQSGAWGNFAKKMFEKCVNTMGYRKCTWELRLHHWAWKTQSCHCNIEIHDNIEKWKASEQVRTHTQGSKTQRHCGFKKPTEYWLFWKVPNFTIEGSNSGLLG